MTGDLPAFILGLVVVVALLVLLGTAAMTWGVDSRNLLADDPAR